MRPIYSSRSSSARFLFAVHIYTGYHEGNFLGKILIFFNSKLDYLIYHFLTRGRCCRCHRNYRRSLVSWSQSFHDAAEVSDEWRRSFLVDLGKMRSNHFCARLVATLVGKGIIRAIYRLSGGPTKIQWTLLGRQRIFPQSAAVVRSKRPKLILIFMLWRCGIRSTTLHKYNNPPCLFAYSRSSQCRVMVTWLYIYRN